MKETQQKEVKHITSRCQGCRRSKQKSGGEDIGTSRGDFSWVDPNTEAGFKQSPWNLSMRERVSFKHCEGSGSPQPALYEISLNLYLHSNTGEMRNLGEQIGEGRRNVMAIPTSLTVPPLFFPKQQILTRGRWGQIVKTEWSWNLLLVLYACSVF